MGKPITNITIVGGGTSGWITAAYLNHRLQWGPTANSDVKITLIESPSISIIGVGEATVPTLKGTMKMMGISEAEFIQRTDATFKLGIWFKDWNKDKDGNRIGYLHPFTGGLTVKGHSPGYSFKKYGLPGRNGNVNDQDFVRTISVAREAIENNQGPRALNGPQFGGALQYAYHIDAGKLAEFLQEVCVKRGVNYVRDDVVDVMKDDRGFIKALKLKERGDWPVELVVDCAGFKGLFINEIMGEPFEYYSDYLLNDRAIPIQIKHTDPMKINSVTTSTALEAGWSWHIPLQNRIGTGYVFSSKFKSDDDALAEFKEHLNGAELVTEPRVIKMRVGRCRKSWVKNVVAMGLSSGFVEPLESTAIMSVELQARWLAATLPSTDFEEPMVEQFNGASARLYDEIRDFLCLHFGLNEREEPYWKAARYEAKKSDSLQHHLELWKYTLPSPLDPRMRAVFSHWSIMCILMGKNFYKDCQLLDTEAVSDKLWQNYWNQLTSAKQRVLGRLASHRQLVDHMVKMSVPGTSVTKQADDGRLIGDGQLLVNPQPIMAQRAPN
ncbi:MAG: tryptophan halogenase family protein [Alphaproteobacteria bacterium]